MLRGSGRQYIGAIMNIVYYIIGLPVGITLALKLKWGVLGVWIGMASGNIVHVSGEIIACMLAVFKCAAALWEGYINTVYGG